MATRGQQTSQGKGSSRGEELKGRAKQHSNGNGISAEALNLSQSGIFLACDTKLSQGSAVDIVMILPKQIIRDAAKGVSCRATVNRVEDERSQGRYGVAATVDRIQAMPELTWPEVDRRITDRRVGERREAARAGQDRRRRERRNPSK